MELLEDRRLLATLGLNVRFFTNDQNAPGSEIQGSLLRGETFWVDVSVQDLRDPGETSQGVIALPLNYSWDPDAFGFESDANLTVPTGNPSLPANDPLVTPTGNPQETNPPFPIQRQVDGYDPDAERFDPTANPGQLLGFFNLRGVGGSALPNINIGQEIGAGMQEPFSQLQFTALANSNDATFTVNLDGAMSFADAAVLDDFVPIPGTDTIDVPALANTVAASIAIEGGRISGMKFDDLNGNGVKDPGEPGLPGIMIQLSGDESDTRVTDADGNYVFDDLAAGDYTVSEMIPSDSVITLPMNNQYMVTLEQGSATADNLDFGNFRLVTLGGTKIDDLNRNGMRDDGEPGVAGVSIGLDLMNTGTFDRTIQTVANGTYEFTDVGPGTHRICEILPVGRVPTFPDDGCYIITVSSGEVRTDLDFGNTDAPTISGIKYDDINGNRIRDSGEPGIGGIEIQLDLNNDNIIDFTTTTATDGTYQFDDVPSGTHAVSEVLPADREPTTPTPVIVTVGIDPITDVDFGNFELTDLGGLVFNDLDGDGIQDPGEEGLALVTVTLNPGGRTDETDMDGRYQFPNVGAGTFTITPETPPGFEPTIPGNAQRTVENRSGEDRADLDFGFREIDGDDRGVITGLVFNDINRNGVVDPGEAGLPGVTISLSGAGISLTTSTAADGSYTFEDLPTGTYRVVETTPAGFDDASISLGTVLPSGETRGTTEGLNVFDGITLGDEEVAIDYNFGDARAFSKRRFLASSANTAAMVPQATTIEGTDGDDQITIEHLAADRVRVVINGDEQILSSSEAPFIVVDAMQGDDSVMVLGNNENEQINSLPSQVTLNTATQSVSVFNAGQIEVNGGGGVDSAILRDSSESDQLTASGNEVLLTAPAGQTIELEAIESVLALSAVDGGTDNATVAAIDFVLRLSGDWI